jgi:hypothetical protein
MERRVVSSWDDNGFRYTVIATPIVADKELISVFDYHYGKTPPYKTGENVYKAAVAAGAVISSKEVITKSYTGKVMLYERSFLDSYFNGLELAAYTPKPMTVPADTMSTYEDDDLPF